MMDKEEFRKNQPVAYRILSHALKSGSLSHAYMLSGPTGAPLKQTALLLAQSVFCPHPDEDGFACQNCLQCHQIAEQNHPDFFRLAQDGRTSYRPLKKKEIQEYWKSGGNVSLPETRPENYVIRKEQIQQLQDFFSLSSSSEKAQQVYVLENFDRATPSASNSLLKFLEEPPLGVIGILTSHHLSNILETIQSRTQIITLRPAGRQIRKAEIQELIEDEKAAAMLADHGMNDQDVIKILKENRLFEMQEAAEKFLKLKASHRAVYYLMHDVFPFKNKEFNRMDFQLFLYWISSLAFENPQLDLERKLKIQETCLEISDLLKTPADAALLLDRFSYQMHQIF